MTHDTKLLGERKGFWIVFFLLLVWAASSMAGPLPKEKVPDPLKPWVGWVLHGVEDTDCPLVYNNLSQKWCAWPTSLNIKFGPRQAKFTQKWEVHAARRWIRLPGNARLWPVQVKINQVENPVGTQGDQPVVWIEKAGSYTITGALHYSRQPEWVQVPENSGLVTLTVSGREIPFPRLDAAGRLWLKQGRGDNSQERQDHCDIRVHRLIRDTIPMRLVTHLDLSISGKRRTLSIGNIQLKYFVPVELESKLPVKINADGQVMIQARPGKWQVRIVLRYKGYPRKLAAGDPGRFQNDSEIWSFASQNDLRMVDIEGPVQVDPQQTDMPGEWKSYPAYLIRPDTVLRFVEKKRGDPRPAPDNLNLKRQLWLDFDGAGYAVRDHITGRMTTGWRLSAYSPVSPGRILLDGKEQFITSLEKTGRAGIEMRLGSVEMETESRIDQPGEIPVTGWDRDFNSVSGQLHLPPGWSLLDASGIDNIQKTWLKSWSLLDLFLVLIISLGIGRLLSLKWGLTALITLVLIRHEPNAPCWVLLHILAAIALLKVIPKGRIYALINNYRLICLASLVLISLPFMVHQIKVGIYPQLKYSWRAMEKSIPRADKSVGTRPQVRRAIKAEAKQAAKKVRSFYTPAEAEYDSLQLERKTVSDAVAPAMDQIDTNAKIQTGAGMPAWQWDTIPFSWNGPVKSDETMRFVFLSPRINMLLGFIRVFLLGLLIYGITGIRRTADRRIDFSSIRPSAFSAGILVLLMLMGGSRTALAENAFPSETLLKQLKTKLTEKDLPDCKQQCAVMPRAWADITGDRLILLLEVHTLYESLAVPLPGKNRQWLPDSVLIDELPANGLLRNQADGHIWVRLDQGIHRIRLSGPLPDRNTIQIAFPLAANHVDVTAKGWRVEGLLENGVIDKQIQFSRIDREKKETFESDLLPPFLEITRVFHLGLTWRIETRVRRTTPPGVAAVLQVPLLAGESVITDIPVKNGWVTVNIAPRQNQVRWVSNLEIKDTLILQAADAPDYATVWKFDISTVWHAGFTGIPVIHHQSSEGRWLPEFRPWPGEKLQMNIRRPAGLAGQTHTIENSRLTYDPGRRITNAALDLTIRSSRGSRHFVTLPPRSKLQRLQVNGKSQPITQQGEKVVLPLVPGEQKIKLSFRTAKESAIRWVAPQVDLGMPSVNAYLKVNMPENRWILFCSGPYVGPAVLFWSSVFVMLLIAIILGRTRLTPLKSYHWFLLGLGLIQVSILSVIPVAVWLCALGLREKKGRGLADDRFNLVQVVLCLLTIAAIFVIFTGIQNGLLGLPNMQVAGNGSFGHTLKWYQDINDASGLPQPVVYSLPMTIYRVLILAWALWIAFSLIRWLRWGWECYSKDGLWRKVQVRIIRKPKPGKEEPR